MIIGRKDTFAFEIGELSEQSYRIRTVDIWAGGTRLCVDDNSAFVDQFTYCLSFLQNKSYLVSEYIDLLDGFTPIEMGEFIDSTKDKNSPNYKFQDLQVYESYRFLDLGPTTDNLTTFLFRTGKSADLVWSFWRKAEIENTKEEFRSVHLSFEETMNTCRSVVELLQEEQKKAEQGACHNAGKPAS